MRHRSVTGWQRTKYGKIAVHFGRVTRIYSGWMTAEHAMRWGKVNL